VLVIPLIEHPDAIEHIDDILGLRRFCEDTVGALHTAGRRSASHTQ
jgi:hypothetical protein